MNAVTSVGQADLDEAVEFRPLFRGGVPSSFGLVLEDSHLQIRSRLVGPLLQFCAPFKGFLVVQSEIGNAVFPASIGHLPDNCRQVEQAKGELIDLLWVVGLQCHSHYSRRNLRPRPVDSSRDCRHFRWVQAAQI